MNLSDLVHRTAGDNNNNKKVLTPNNSSNGNITNNPRLSQSMNGYNNSHLFQPNVIDPTVSPSNMFTNFARQDQQFLFSMPNTDWVNNNLFFNNNGLMNGQDPLIEPMNQSTSSNDMSNLYMKQDFLPTNINHNTSSSTTTATTTTTTTTTPMTNINNFNNNYTQRPPTQQLRQHQQQPQPPQQAKGYPLIAPFQHNLFQNFDLSNGPPPPPPSAQPPQNTATHFQNNDHVQFNTNKFITTTTPASEITNASVATAAAAQSVTSLPNAQSLTTSNSSTTAETTTTTTTADDLQTPKSVSEQPLIPKPKVKITGDNVTSANIEEGYIQFVLEHDASYISDGIDSLVYAKRKFQSVPKTGDISYTTWDIYQLVLKLHKQEIKNWSQLVGQLGLHDMAGRPQFAQRVKRWMNRYKIDCYFDYLLGNEYKFDAPEGKYSTCLMIGNYKKRKSDNNNNTNNVHAAANDSDEEELEEDQSDQEPRIPVLLAGSRKRMRDGSHNSLQMIENAQKFLRPHQSESEEEEEDGDEEDAEDEELQGSDAEDDSDMRVNANTEDEDVEMAVADEDAGQDEDSIEEDEEEEEELAEDEEDELASSTSSPISPARIIIPAPIATTSPPTSPAKSETPSPVIREPTTASPNIANVSPAASSLAKSSTTASPSFTHKSTIASPSFMHRPMAATSPATSTSFSMSSFSPGTAKLPSSPPRQPPPPLSLLSIPPLSSCSNCMANDEKVATMETELSDLRAHVAQLESQLEKQNTQVNKLLRLRDRTERWRKQIISDLARGPQIASDNDDDEDEDDDDDDEDDDDEDDDTTHSTNRP